VCEHTGWELGHAFLASTSAAGELRSSHVWHVDDPARYERFMRATAVVRLTAGDGLCGRVLATGRPAWSDEVEDQRLSQRTLVQGASLGAGFAVPVLARDELVGVLEFYSTAAVPRDEGLLEVMRYVGTQLGRAVERHRAEDQLRHQAMHDPLTGLPNRVLFAEHVAYAVARHARTSYQVAVLLIDLDGFKKVNDGLGHAVGDELLVHVGQRLRAAARPVDTVARLGGDEFAVLVVDSGDGSVVEGVAAAALDAVAERIPLAGRHVSVTASVGVAVASDEAGDGVEELLAQRRSRDVPREGRRQGAGHVLRARLARHQLRAARARGRPAWRARAR
jgi:diguanylate cyclase (GGDEF)-like protein